MRSVPVGLLATCALLASAAADCALHQIVAEIRCGDALDISTCLKTLPDNLIHPACLSDDSCARVLEGCLRSAHCSAAQARLELTRLARASCGDAGADADADAGPAIDLLKRKDKSPKPAATANEDTTTGQDTKTSNTPKPADATTPSAVAETITSTAGAIASPPPSTLSTVMASPSSMGSSEISNSCFATSLSTYTWTLQSTDPAGSVVTSTSVTTTPIVSCQPGLLCQKSIDGNTTCMVRQDTLTTSGVLVAVIFSIAVAGFCGAIIVMCCRSNRPRRSDGPDIGPSLPPEPKPGNAATKPTSGMRSTSETHLPLMSAQGPAGGGAGMYSTEYGSGGMYQTASRKPSAGHLDVSASKRTPQQLLSPNSADGYSQDVRYGRQ